jgi:hypothetical protein
MPIRHFKLQLDDDGYEAISAVVVIREDVDSLQLMREMVYFWSGAIKVVEKYKGDITKSFLHYVGGSISSHREQINSMGDLQHHFSNEEGFYPLFDNNWFVFR